MNEIARAVEGVFREESGRVIAHLVRVLGDFDVAEDALQDAFSEALTSWERSGVPERPAAWVQQTAKRRAIDRLRARRKYTQRTESLDPEAPDTRDELEKMERWLDTSIEDDRLRLVFTCCHPALAPEAQVALTLRTLGGLSTAAIANAFLVPEPTIAQRIVRAKKKIVAAGIPFRVPSDSTLPERLPAVLAVVYLIFNEGHSASGGNAPIRGSLCDEALRLADLIAKLMPDEEEVQGMLALLLLQDSRRSARLDDRGEIVLLEDQDRSRWNHEAIARGRELLIRTLGRKRPGPYQFQASIAAVHADAPSFAQTDWDQIVALYDQLLGVHPSPVAALNRAAALANRDGPESALQLLDELLTAHPALDDYVFFHTTHAELLHRAGRSTASLAALERAIPLAPTSADARLLRQRMERRERSESGE